MQPSDHREYGEAIVTVLKQPAGSPAHLDKLFQGMEGDMPVRPTPLLLSSICSTFSIANVRLPLKSKVWMSHSDRLHSLPEHFSIIATTESAPFAAIAHNSMPLYGIQFHPEVTHSPRGKEVLERFVVGICECKREWTMVRLLRFFSGR